MCFSGKASITLDRYLHGFFMAHSLTEARSLGQTFKAQRRNLCLPSPQISEENKSFHCVARYKQEKQTTTTKIQHRKQSRGCSLVGRVLVRHIQSSVFALNTAYIQKKKKFKFLVGLHREFQASLEHTRPCHVHIRTTSKKDPDALPEPPIPLFPD